MKKYLLFSLLFFVIKIANGQSSEQWIEVKPLNLPAGYSHRQLDLVSVRRFESDFFGYTIRFRASVGYAPFSANRYAIINCRNYYRYESTNIVNQEAIRYISNDSRFNDESKLVCERANFYNNSVGDFGKAERERLVAEVEAARRRQQELENRLAAEAEAERKKRQEVEQRLAAAEARERERIQAQAQPAPQTQRPQVALRSERRIALIVGNAAYKISPLDNPVNDATDVDAGLRRAGFQTTLLRNATLAQMREATRRFADQLATADVALIYFAGHGIESKGRNFMVPVNADLKFEYELADQAYDANQWLEMLEGIRSANADRVNIVILDACRDNSLIGSRSLSRGLGRLDAPSGTFLAYSTAPGKVALDGPRGERNSPFTKHLLRAMQQPNLPIEEVFKEVRRNVSRETAGAQVPWESTSLTGFFTFQRGP